MGSNPSGLWTRICTDATCSAALICIPHQCTESTIPANYFYYGILLLLYYRTSLYIFLQNHRAERHWVEINSRINYPIKHALIEMQQYGIIDMDCPITKFCVSMMSGKLSQVGIQAHILAWNNHRIPGA